MRRGTDFMKTEKITNRNTIFTANESEDSTVTTGIIRGKAHNFIVDTGTGGDFAQAMIDSLADSSLPIIVINTHHHWDHVYGNWKFEGNKIIAHKLCAEYMDEKWDESLAWRLVLVIACAVFFGLLHYDQGFTGIIITGVCGLLFGAAYVYSKNLLSIILLHALNNSVNSAQNIFIRVDLEMTHHFDGLLAPVTIVFCVVGVVVSIAATIKATPFMPPVSEETK